MPETTDLKEQFAARKRDKDREAALEFLRDLIADGNAAFGSVIQAAQLEGISEHVGAMTVADVMAAKNTIMKPTRKTALRVKKTPTKEIPTT